MCDEMKRCVRVSTSLPQVAGLDRMSPLTRFGADEGSQRIGSPVDLHTLEKQISVLVTRYQASPFAYFSEWELHAEFFGLCRQLFGAAKPLGDDFELTLFRYEYNTTWRYSRREGPGAFSTRSHNRGKAGSLDFVILRREFVEKNSLCCVVNKHEPLRKALRRQGWPSTALSVAIEFKMAHITAERAPSRQYDTCRFRVV